MMTYVSAFIFYTLAMIGVMLVGFIVYKKTFNQNPSLSKGMIKIIDSAPIGNKKMLHIVKIKNESFLIASGLEHTTFLARLDSEDVTLDKKEEKADDVDIEALRARAKELKIKGYATIKTAEKLSAKIAEAEAKLNDEAQVDIEDVIAE